MKGIKEISTGFFARKGAYVFTATFLARILSFTASWIALQLLSEQKLGLVIFSFNFIIFLIPIAGFGLEQSYIRYAALVKNRVDKQDLFIFTFKKGLVISIFLSISVALIGYFVKIIPIDAKLFFIIVSFSLVSHFILSMLKNYYRIQHKNKIYAFLEVTFNLILVLSVSVLSYFFKEIGYSLALVIAPLLASLFFIPKLLFKKQEVKKPDSINLSFWQYGFSASLSNVATQLLFALDLILIGTLITDSQAITHYKYISLIPFSLLFIPQVLLTTDFVNLTEQVHKKDVIYKYIKNYWSLMAIISTIILIVSFIFSNEILSLFKREYITYSSSFKILIIGVLGILLLRGLFGNLLSAIGKAHSNFWIAIISLLLNLVSNFYFIPKYGIKGAAITSAFVMWFSGIISFFVFVFYYKNKENF